MNGALRRCIRSAVLLGAIGWAGIAVAQQAQDQPAKSQTKAEPTKRKAAAKKEDGATPKLDAATAQSEVEAGVNALAQGRPDAAVTSLSNALTSGSLPQPQTARALYYRGVAFRRQGKPAQSISDLTSALWIKSGLSEEQRADALQQRSGAYREAGLPDQAGPPGAPAASKAASAPAKTGGVTMFTAVAPAGPSSGSGGNFFSSLFGGGTTASTSTSSAPTAAPASPPPTPAPQLRPTPAAVATPSPQPSAPASPALSASADKPATRLVPITSTRSSLPAGFQDVPDPVRHVEVSTRAPIRVAATQQPSTDVAAKPSVDTTKVKTTPQPATTRSTATPNAGGPPPPAPQASAPPPVKAEPRTKPEPRARPEPTAKPAAPEKAEPMQARLEPRTKTAAATPPASPIAAGGNVRVLIAAVRNAEEAQGIASRLQLMYRQELAGRAPIIDQTTVGGLGTLYRVQVGPFASARDTEGLCSRLKREGMDCRIVAQ